MFCRMILVVGLLTLVAVDSTTPTLSFTPATPSKTTPAHTVHVIALDKMAFGPMPVGVRTGNIIEWVNHDIFEHSATARDGSFDIDLKSGTTVRTAAKAGSFSFFCKFHPGMTGTLVVK